MAKNESSKSKAEIYREERKERLAKAAKKNAKNVKARNTAVSVAKKAVAVLLAVAVVGLAGWFVVEQFGIYEKFATALTVGDTKVSVAQYEYYYSMSYQYFQQMEMSYQQQNMSMGFPLDKAPDEVKTGQKDANGNEMYYDQAIADYASNLAFQQFSLYAEAKAANYSLTKDEQKQIDDAIASIKEQADANGYSLNAFIREYYSRGLNAKALEELLEIEILAGRYNTDLEAKSGDNVTAAQLDAEYKANPNTYNYAHIRYYSVTLPTVTKAASETDDEFAKRKDEVQKTAIADAQGIHDKVTDSESLKVAALEYANKDLKENEKPAEGDVTVENKGITFEAIKTSLSEDAAKWIFDANRKAGDKNIFKTDKAAYIVIIESPVFAGNSVDIRHCLIKFDVKDNAKPTDEQKKAAYEEAEKLRAEWAKKGTEEAFIEMVKANNDDTASTANGGLYEDVRHSSNYVASFKNWALDSSRKTGDCEIVETEYGYHIMYFVKDNGPDWKLTAKEKLTQDAYTEAFEAILGKDGKYSMVKNEKNIDSVKKDFCKKLRTSLAQRAAQGNSLSLG